MLSAKLSFEVSRETLVNAGFTWLFIGAVIWAFMDWSGIVRKTFAIRCAMTDPTEARRYMVFTTLYTIVAWPHVVWAGAVRPYLRRRSA